MVKFPTRNKGLSGQMDAKHVQEDDEDTVQSSGSDEDQKMAGQSGSKLKKRKNRLTKISALYDLDGDGCLDEVEQAMRDRDVDNDGDLSPEEIYELVKDQLAIRKRRGQARMLVAGLLCFVFLLAASSLGTSWAAAVLAKDVAADDGGPEGVAVMRDVVTNHIAAVQSAADVFEADELSDEEIDERRLRVLAEIDADPHSHGHRRNLAGCKGGRNGQSRCNGKVSFDTRSMPQERFERVESQCGRQQNVYMKRRLQTRNTKNDCLCGQGSSVIVKEKKRTLTARNSGFGKKKKNPKPKYGPCNRKDVMEGCGTTYYDSTDDFDVEVRTQKVRVRKPKVKNTCQRCKDKTILIQRNGRTAHADCEDGTCFIGGDLLFGDIGDPCLVRGDDCDVDLVCVAESKTRNGGSNSRGTCRSVEVSMTDVVVARNARGGYCNLDEGWDACDNGLFCQVDGVDGIALRSGRDGGRVGGCGGAGYSGVSIAGPSGVVNTGNAGRSCRRHLETDMDGGKLDDETNATNADEKERDLQGYQSGYQVTGASGSITTGFSGGSSYNGGGMRARNSRMRTRSTGVGMCTRSIGLGQTCTYDDECGFGNFCAGIGEMQCNNPSGVLIQGPSGVIDTRECTGTATTGVCRVG